MALAAVLVWSWSGSARASSSSPVTTGPVAPVSAPGGSFLRDAHGRVVLMHGVDLMYKLPPYEIVTSGAGVNVLTNAEAASIASDGFDVVRLGILWKGLEPGTAPMNDPAICTPGKPKAAGPGQFDLTIFNAYMTKLEQTISLLARHGIYSLVDMHQDSMNEVFAGEGFPDWAVCTDGITPVAYRNVAAWGVNQIDAGMAQAQGHFWANDVVGNLQGAYDQIWAKVASRLAGNPWVVGYDPFNEPFSPSILLHSGQNAAFDAQVQCFYAGRAQPGKTQSGQPITDCPTDDPELGVIPTIERADHRHAVFYEPDTTTSGPVPNRIGPMDFPRLVYNFHDYCPLHVPNGPEAPDYSQVCPSPEEQVFADSARDRARTPHRRSRMALAGSSRSSAPRPMPRTLVGWWRTPTPTWWAGCIGSGSTTRTPRARTTRASGRRDPRRPPNSTPSPRRTRKRSRARPPPCLSTRRRRPSISAITSTTPSRRRR